MAHYFIFPLKDTFVSNEYQYLDRNFGIDEVLEVEKVQTTRMIQHYSHSIVISGALSQSFHVMEPPTYETVSTETRALLHFDITEVSQSVATGSITSPRFYLNLKTVEATNCPMEYSLVCYPISQSWEMGLGTKYINEAAGASWLYRDESMTAPWVAGASRLIPSGGGNWYADVSGSQMFQTHRSDVHMEVTPIVNSWIRGVYPNNGIILMHSGSAEIDYGKLRFYSMDTNTIYSPSLEVCWDDSVYATGSMMPMNLTTWGLTEIIVNVSNLQSEYLQSDSVRINVHAREKYPQKSFDRSYNPVLEKKYLPPTVYYSVKDAETDEVLIGFDEFSRISLDSYGHYFILHMAGFAQERYYKLRIKLVNGVESKIYESPTAFKIRR